MGTISGSKKKKRETSNSSGKSSAYTKSRPSSKQETTEGDDDAYGLLDQSIRKVKKSRNPVSKSSASVAKENKKQMSQAMLSQPLM